MSAEHATIAVLTGCSTLDASRIHFEVKSEKDMGKPQEEEKMWSFLASSHEKSYRSDCLNTEENIQGEEKKKETQ